MLIYLGTVFGNEALNKRTFKGGYDKQFEYQFEYQFEDWCLLYHDILTRNTVLTHIQLFRFYKLFTPFQMK